MIKTTNDEGRMTNDEWWSFVVGHSSMKGVSGTTMPHILVICTANICRSPVVAALLRQRFAARQMNDWTVSSAGTWAENGHKAANYSAQVMAEQDIDLSDHRSEIINADSIAAADLILCMESGHVEALRAEFPQYANRIFLLSEMARKRFSVADPYGRSLDAYKRMTREVTALIDAGWPRILELAQGNGNQRSAVN
jgi:protein-tyrosine-phosphatase